MWARFEWPVMVCQLQPLNFFTASGLNNNLKVNINYTHMPLSTICMDWRTISEQAAIHNIPLIPGPHFCTILPCEQHVKKK